MHAFNDRAPVLVGVGEITQRTKDPTRALEPLALMEGALRAADDDVGGGVVAALDSLDVVSEYSWPYPDAPGQLCERLGIAPDHREYGTLGGDSPVRFIHDAALRIWRGETAVAAVVGAEANYAVAAAAKVKAALPWSPRDPCAKLIRGVDYLHPLAVKLGVATPATVYPFYENAATAAWRQSPRQALAESGQLWAGCSQVAADNPHAWQREALTADQITTPARDNRLVAWPYTVRMVANPLVNQGAAVLLMSHGEARRRGIAEDSLVFLWCGAAAAEPKDYLLRDQYVRSHAQETVLERVLAQAGRNGTFRHVELYSCFPIVPKMARRTLGMSVDATVTSTGGLSFFGAPLNNYMTHACAGLVRELRGHRGAMALLYGQGGYLTSHHAIVLAAGAPDQSLLADDYSVQAEADRRRGEIPRLALDHIGFASLEAHTVLYGRNGAPTHGVVILRTPECGRLLARVDPMDSSTISALTDLDRSPIGRVGHVQRTEDGTPHWRIAP
jgi:acetyl-CoA C-acetyltransferase